MAEINNQPSQKKHKRTQCEKKSTKVDLTPMVDLGFILITFFIFTSALTDPKAMNLLVPNDQDTSQKDNICESCALTFIAGDNNKLYYYEGKEENAVFKTTDYSSKGIRQLIVNKKKDVTDQFHRDRTVVIIKPASTSSFKNLIDVIDECNISVVKRYYIAELSETEKAALQKQANMSKQ